MDDLEGRRPPFRSTSPLMLRSVWMGRQPARVVERHRSRSRSWRQAMTCWSPEPRSRRRTPSASSTSGSTGTQGCRHPRPSSEQRASRQPTCDAATGCSRRCRSSGSRTDGQPAGGDVRERRNSRVIRRSPPRSRIPRARTPDACHGVPHRRHRRRSTFDRTRRACVLVGCTGTAGIPAAPRSIAAQQRLGMTGRPARTVVCLHELAEQRRLVRTTAAGHGAPWSIPTPVRSWPMARSVSSRCSDTLMVGPYVAAPRDLDPDGYRPATRLRRTATTSTAGSMT